MFRYYKNLLIFSSMFSSPENGGGSNLQQEKQKLIDTVNNIDLTQEQLNKIKQELISNGKIIDNLSLQNWKDREINLINMTENQDELNSLKLKYTKLQNEITKESGVNRNNLVKEIHLINANKIKKMKPTTLPTQIHEIPSQTTTEAPPPTHEKSTNSNIQIKHTWVKQALTSNFFNDINSPTNDEVINVLEGFKGFETIKDGSSARVIYAIQVALNKLGIPVDVDGVYKDKKTGKSNTKNAIAKFQSEQMHLGRTNGNPGPKTIKALISKLEKSTQN